MINTPHSTPQNVCLIRLSAIGDTCQVLPVIRTLKANWPAARFTWIIGKVEATLMQGIEDVELVVFDKSRGWRAFADVRNALRGRRFDVLLHMHASMRANMASLTVRAPIRLGFDRARGRDFQWLFTNRKLAARQRRHVLDGFFEFAEYLGVNEREMRWEIPLSDQDRHFARQQIDPSTPSLVISPCSSQRFRNFRNWSVANYAAVADYAAETYGAQVLLSGGNSELEHRYASDIVAACRSNPRSLVGRTTLKQLLSVLEAASVVLCPDSGPAHMACAVHTPVIGLYATSNRYRTGPYLYQDLVVDRYPQAVEREFGKSPDDVSWGQRVRDPDAMDLIEVDEVKSKLDQVLSG